MSVSHLSRCWKSGMRSDESVISLLMLDLCGGMS